MLERYFHRVFMETGKYTRIGRWWDRKGENEIDMIAADELSESVTFFEIKRQQEEISIGVLKQKAEAFLRATYQFNDYKVSYEGLSLQQM
jgi:Holliday junction resolvase-like predicted endonuclease